MVNVVLSNLSQWLISFQPPWKKAGIAEAIFEIQRQAFFIVEEIPT